MSDLNRILEATPLVNPLTYLESAPKVIVFGAGGTGRAVYSELTKRSIGVAFFVDNDASKHGSQLFGLDINPPTAAVDAKFPIVIASDWEKDIANQLISLGIKNYISLGYVGWTLNIELSHHRFFLDEIFLKGAQDVCDLLEDDASKNVLYGILRSRMSLDPAYLDVSDYPQYQHRGVHAIPGDVVIDGGAWIGDTANLFYQSIGGQGKIYSFEPEPANYEALSRSIDESVRSDVITAINSGLWSSTTASSLSRSTTGSAQHRISENGDQEIKVVSIDDFRRQHRISIDLIKMDIEGAELAALQGASETLRADCPKLQICVYHKPADIWMIPQYIKRINPRYRFFLGHHSQTVYETVLYAIPADDY